jgi:carboxyl-terminal processing protease
MKKSIFIFTLLILATLAQPSIRTTTAHERPPHYLENDSTRADGVRACLYVPGVSTPTSMPAAVLNAPTPTPYPTATLPAPTKMDAKTTAKQVRVYRGLWNAVNENYVYRDFRGRNWRAIGARYESLVKQGLSDADFYGAMQSMINELGDGHSYFQSPAKVKEDEDALASRYNFVGVGFLATPIAGTEHAAIMTVFPDSPAAEAGLRSHDMLLKVDSGPIRDKSGASRTLGPEGSSVTLTVQRPGEAARDVVLTRRRVTGALLIDYCLISGTRIGYIFLPTLLDTTMDEQVRTALQNMTADGPLDGLVLDNRMNGGGSGETTQAILGLFVGGVQGHFVTRQKREPINIKAVNVNGSQTMPLVVLIGSDTVSYAEIMSGVLRVSGRARVIGSTSAGNVEQLRRYELEDGSRAWIASATFQPLGQTSGVWEGTGIVPDVSLPTRWDLFTEATDPALAKAVELLGKK